MKAALRSSMLRVLLIVGLFVSLTTRADLTLPGIFSDNMVLQRGKPVKVWGWADDGTPVIVKFNGQTHSAVAWNKKWEVTLRPMLAGGPFEFTVSTPNEKVRFNNVLIGDVWVCSGQSNMQFPMDRSYESEPDINSATNALIHLIDVPRIPSDAPSVRVGSTWKTCSPGSVRPFSAVGYYFGRELQRALNVPIGLIGTYWGGTPAESWCSQEALEIDPELKAGLLDTYAEAEKQHEEAMAAYRKEKEAAQAQGKKFTKRAPRLRWKPTVLYNGMIAPLIPYAIKGAIWYQGESNASRAEQYRKLFPDMIRCWRRDWGQGDFPFFLVQLAPFRAVQDQPGDSDWAELREAQLLSTQVLPNVGMAVITDVGNPKDIHPRKKQPVGARLALAARGIAYGEDIVYSGPVYRDMEVEGNKIVLSFDHVGSGLEARDGDLKGFAICGVDQKWVWADAQIQPDNTIVVSSPKVKKPVAVRFGWADCPVVNLWNKDGLPATPFRTDSFPMITAGNK